MSITAGTKMAAILSARRAMGGLAPWAFCTISTIWASTVSRPTLVASKVNEPLLLMVPPITIAPTSLVTGMDSPVNMDSSMAEPPSVILPSTGIFSPGRTTTRSPTNTLLNGISASLPSRIIRAVCGVSPMSLRMAWEVRPLARFSRKRPRRINTMMAPEVSK